MSPEKPKNPLCCCAELRAAVGSRAVQGSILPFTPNTRFLLGLEGDKGKKVVNGSFGCLMLDHLKYLYRLRVLGSTNVSGTEC